MIMTQRLAVLTAALLCIAPTAPAIAAEAQTPAADIKAAFPTDMECVPQPVYRHRADGTPGREILLNLKGAKIYGAVQVELTADGHAETIALPAVAGGCELVACCCRPASG